MMRSTFIIVLIILISSCNPDKQRKNTGNVFRYNESSGITSLDPAFAKDLSNIWACHQLYNGP